MSENGRWWRRQQQRETHADRERQTDTQMLWPTNTQKEPKWRETAMSSHIVRTNKAMKIRLLLRIVRENGYSQRQQEPCQQRREKRRVH